MPKFSTLANPFKFNNNDIGIAVDGNKMIWVSLDDLSRALNFFYGCEDIPNEWITEILLSAPNDRKLFISEPAMYYFIFKLYPSVNSIAFADWFCSSVIADIRKSRLIF